MLIQRISRSDPERVFIVVRADEAGCDRGWTLSWKADGTRNGIDVLQCDAVADIALMCGMAHTDIGNTDYGLAQCYGYDDDVIILQSGTTFTRGNPLIFSSAKSCWAESSASAPNGESVHAQVAAMSTLATTATSRTTRLPCFLRMM